jgi:HEAT repeat protein
MKTVTVCVWTFLLVAGSLKPAFSQTPEGLLESPSPLSTWFAAQAGGAAGRSEGEETQLYEKGTQALDQRRWDRAQQLFDDVIKLKGRRTDGALYWKAYAQNKQGQRPEALATLAALRSGHPQSSWLKEAAALEVEVRQASGQSVSPEKTGDEELKLIAINSLLHSDSEKALPMLEKFLQGSQPPKLKERALFVLTQSGSPRGREIVAGIARGNSNPELQMQALKYLGLFGGKESRQVLADIYGSSASVDVKKAILRSFMVAGERERLFAAAKGEAVPELRREAIRQLGVMGAQAEIWQLYQSETTVENKKELIRSMFISGNAEKLLELARTEKDAGLRRSAIRNLGTMGESKSGEALVTMYANEKEPDIRKEIIQALFLQQNAKALVDIARKETDPELKKQAVQKLSLMNSKEGTEYFMEILNK